MIIQSDLFDVLGMPQLLSKFNLVVTSPPYFNARNYGGRALFEYPLEWENWCISVLLSLKEVITDDGVIWWNTGSGYKDHKKMINIYSMIHHCDLNQLYLIDEIPWVKKSSPPKKINNRPYPAWEHNYIFAKNPELVTFYRDNVRRPYAESTLKRMKYEVSQLSGDLDGEYNKRKKVIPNLGGATPPNYLLLPQDTTARPHPAPMLPALANWAIRAYSKEGDWVLDPMAGIGTTWIECVKLERNFMGIELFPEYIEIARMSLIRLERGDHPYLGLKKEWEERHG